MTPAKLHKMLALNHGNWHATAKAREKASITKAKTATKERRRERDLKLWQEDPYQPNDVNDVEDSIRRRDRRARGGYRGRGGSHLKGKGKGTRSRRRGGGRGRGQAGRIWAPITRACRACVGREAGGIEKKKEEGGARRQASVLPCHHCHNPHPPFPPLSSFAYFERLSPRPCLLLFPAYPNRCIEGGGQGPASPTGEHLAR